MDEGAVSDDAWDGLASVVGMGTVDTQSIAQYSITYDFSDSSGNAAQTVTRVINVIDSAAPIITLNVTSPYQHEAGTSFTDPGAVSNDAQDGPEDILGEGVVTANAPGTYTLTYTAADSAGNQATPVTSQ